MTLNCRLQAGQELVVAAGWGRGGDLERTAAIDRVGLLPPGGHI